MLQSGIVDQLRLSYRTEMGIDGCDDSPVNPLSRAVRSLLNSGRPIKKLLSCFVATSKEAFRGADVRWFGVFVMSAGGRVLFFPGFSFDELGTFHGMRLPRAKQFSVDHITLERDWRRWHITDSRSRDHQGGPRTAALGCGRILWFDLSVRDLGVFRPVRKETLISIDVPGSDARRRFQNFRAAKDHLPDQFFSLPPGVSETVGRPSFPHFSVIVGQPDFPRYRAITAGLLRGSPFLDEPLPDELAPLPVMTYRFNIGRDAALQVTTCILPGRLNVPASLTGV